MPCSKIAELFFVGFGTGFPQNFVVLLYMEVKLDAQKQSNTVRLLHENGEITTIPKEVYAVSTIFSEYLNGSSLLQIAKLMESEKYDIVPIPTVGTKIW